MASIWNSPWDTNNDWYNKMLASGQYWNDWDLAHASQDQNFANTIFQAKSDYANATTDEGRALANANAEAARRNYNYTSGTAGAEYNPFGNGVTTPGGGSSFWGGEMMDAYNNVKNQPSFNYTPYQAPERFSFSDFQAPSPFQYEEFKAPEPFQYEAYENTTPDFQHSDAYNRTMADVLGYGDFSYDYTTDPLYDVYAKEYTREGRRASEDALAQAAAMTGGVPSSYANMVGQQAGNYYAAQLADKIPELRAQALNEYNNKFNQLMSKHGVANAGDQFDYGIYKDKLNQDYQQYLDDLNMRYGIYSDEYNRTRQAYDTDRNFAYNQYSDDYARDWDRYVNDRNFSYSQYADDRNFGYNQWLDQTNLDRAINQDNYNRAMDQYGLAGDNYWQMHGEDLDAAAAEDAKKLDYAKLLAGLGDYSGYTDYYGDSRAADAYAALLAAQQAKGYGGGGNNPTTTRLTIPQATWDEIFAAANMDDTGKSALDNLTQYWDYLSDNQRDELARLGGIDADDLAALGGATKIGLNSIGGYAGLLNPQPLTKTEFNDDYDLLLKYGTYENYLNGTPANSTNGGFGSGYGSTADRNGVRSPGLYERARSIMSGAGNDEGSKNDASDRVYAMLDDASENGTLTDAGMAYILQSLGLTKKS